MKQSRILCLSESDFDSSRTCVDVLPDFFHLLSCLGTIVTVKRLKA